ncbi:MAG: dual specificity protein phosphatase family protein [Aggregatilineales bacterium]
MFSVRLLVRANKSQGKVVLVACGAGISRSVTFAMAVLMEEEDLTFTEAYREILAVHPDAMPNPFLVESLSSYYHLGYDLITIVDQLDAVQRGE